MHTLSIIAIFYTALLAFWINNAVASPDVSEIQRQFNAETVNKRFSVPSDAALTSALKEATQRGTPTRTQSFGPGCFGLGCVLGQNTFGYGSYFGGYTRPYYGGYYGATNYLPYYHGW